MKGGCIVGIKGDYKLNKIKTFIKKTKDNKITIIIETINNDIIQKNINNKIKNDYSDNKIIDKIIVDINKIIED